MTNEQIILKKEELYNKPEEQLIAWFELARQSGLPKPEGFALASLGLDGFPKARWVLHKGFIDNSVCFYTNYESAKAQEIASNPRVSATFYWDEPMDVQVRLEGIAEKLSKKDSEAYFHSRPRGSQIGAWASPQSTKIESREEIEAKFREIEARFPEGSTIPLPEFWGGYQIKAMAYDFMLLRRDRLHDRYRFEQTDGEWTRSRLAP